MKKPAKSKPGRKGKKKGPLAGLLSDVDLDMLRSLLQGELPGSMAVSIEDRLESFLTCDPISLEDMPDAQEMANFAEDLDSLRVDANGGDPQARETLKSIRELVDKAARKNDIHPGVLILMGKLFAQSKVDIGDAARASMGRMVAAGLFREPGQEGYADLVEPLLGELDGDDFALHEEIRCVIAIFPGSYRAGVVESLASGADERVRRSAAGFLLDPDEGAALAAIRGFAAASARGDLDAKSRARIALMRSWLPPARAEALDRAIPPAAASRAGPGESPAAKLTASACDGSGASSLMATIKRGRRFDVVFLLAAARGIVDSSLFGDLSKSEAQEMEDRMKASMLAAEASREDWIQLVRLALGRNVTTALPPFELVRALEMIGLEAALPDLATPAAILDRLLADCPDADGSAIGAAHEAVAGSEAVESWFEAGEAVELILQPTETVEEGAQAVLEDYLPGRRAFWTRQCALTAIALRSAPLDQWRAFALVGRDLAGDRPLTQIPLMLDVAEQSAVAYFANRR